MLVSPRRRRAAARGRLAGRIAHQITVDAALATGPDVEVERSLVAELVHTFFRALPGKQRQVFDLVDLQGFSQAAIAEMLGMNPATVRAHLFRARRAIRAKILAHDPALGGEVS